MKVLIKIGGTLLDAPESRLRVAGEIARAIQGGLRAVIVHGGGKQLTRYLAEHGVQSRFVNGLRISTPEVMDAVLKVLAGSVNQELVAALVSSGARAIGLSGMDALLTQATQMSEELGSVGKPVESDAQLLDLLLENGYLPVVACLAGDRQGRFFNVNADQMGVSLAAAIGAQKLLFLTDVEGVRGNGNAIYPVIAVEECRLLIQAEIATGGMRAKLEAAAEALRLGVGEVVIAPGAAEGIVRRLVAGDLVGTRVVGSASEATRG